MKPTDILHRAKTLNGEWVEGYYNTNIGNCNHLIRSPENGGTVLTENKDSYCTFSGKMYIIDPSTLCVWTTLLDKNGKKVFSGDIMMYALGTHEEDILAKVEWSTHDARYVLVNDSEYINEEFDYDTCLNSIIVGNIFDNKELIEEI